MYLFDGVVKKISFLCRNNIFSHYVPMYKWRHHMFYIPIFCIFRFPHSQSVNFSSHASKASLGKVIYAKVLVELRQARQCLCTYLLSTLPPPPKKSVSSTQKDVCSWP